MASGFRDEIEVKSLALLSIACDGSANEGQLWPEGIEENGKGGTGPSGLFA
jgi:hypothetical protein